MVGPDGKQLQTGAVTHLRDLSVIPSHPRRPLARNQWFSHGHPVGRQRLHSLEERQRQIRQAHVRFGVPYKDKDGKIVHAEYDASRRMCLC